MTNPLLTELSQLSPGAQQALVQAHSAMGGPGTAANPQTTAAASPAPRMEAPTAPAPQMGKNELGDPMGRTNELGAGLPPPADAPAIAAPKPSLGTQSGDEAERTRLLSTGSGVSQIHNPVLRGLAGVGNAIGSIAAPGLMRLIPGTEEHHEELLGRTNKNLTGDLETGQKEATIGETQARTGGLNATTAHTEAEIPQIAPNAESQRSLQGATTEHLGVATENLRNPQDTNPDMATYRSLVKMGMSPREALQEIEQDKALALKPTTGEHINVMGPDGKTPIVATYDPATRKTYDSTGKEIANPVPYEKPTSVNVDSNRAFQEAERGRGLLDKAEGQFRTAQQGAQGIRAMIDDALQGGKISAKMLPLEGALEVTTANGVKRINRTEVDQYAGGGSLFDKLAGQLRGATSGIPFTDEIMQDMKRLADLQEKGAYDNYKGAYDSATHRYHLTDEQPLSGPSGGGASSGLAVSLADARQLPQYKGKSDAEITADIVKYGHKVKP